MTHIYVVIYIFVIRVAHKPHSGLGVSVYFKTSIFIICLNTHVIIIKK